MGTLLGKILLWFWLALAVIIGANLLLETRARQREFPRHGRVDSPHAFDAAVAGEALQREGRAGLVRILTLLETRTRDRAYCFDQSGAEIRRRAAPEEARILAAEVLRTNAPEARKAKRQLFVGYPMPAAGVDRLALVFQPLPPPESLLGMRLPFRGLPRDLGLRALVLILVGGLGCYVLARYLTAPVKRLKHATHRLAEGDLSARVGSHGSRRDELEDLGRDFDRMAERMETMVSAQRRLLTDISHELRSPLARINVALGILRQRGIKDPSGMVARLETEAERLNRLIGDLLLLSRLESGSPGSRARLLPLDDLVREVVEDACFEASTRNRMVRLTRSSEIEVEGEPELLRSAIENVVRNAVRHTPEGTAVEVAVWERRDSIANEAVIEVRDHGEGVPQEQVAKIFEPFYRVDDARTRRSGGVGLGLAIARRAVLQHGGCIEAARVDGGGFRVEIRLPLDASRAG